MSGGDGDWYQQQQQQQELQEARDMYFMDAADFILFIKSTIMMDKDIV
jgi:hypothetical protein